MNSRTPFNRISLIILFSLLILAQTGILSAFAQPNNVDVDRAIREIDRSKREEAEKVLYGPERKKPLIQEAPTTQKVSGGMKFLVKKINVVGAVTVSPEELAPLTQKYENREITLGDLDTLGDEIKSLYLGKGLIAAYFVPPQDIKEGVVTVQVVEAKMGELVIQQDYPFFDKKKLRSQWTIKPGAILNYNELSKTVQLMNKNPDKKVNATLAAGKKPETTDVILNVKSNFPIHPIFSFDREGAVTTGRERTGLSVRHNNFLRVDDTLLTGSTVGKDFYGMYAYHSVPITNFGTSIMYGYSVSKSSPKKDFESYVIRSSSENSSFYVYQDLFKEAEYVGEASLGFDANDKATTDAANGTITRDRLRILRGKTMLVHRFPGCVTYISPQISQGLDILGARSKSELTSRGSDDTFTKFNLSIRHRRALPLDMTANLAFLAQVASEKLAPQEQFALGGIDSVRGYPSQDYMGDHGLQCNAELLFPPYMIPEDMKIPFTRTSLRKSLQGVVFFDYGFAERRSPSPTEAERVNFAGVGAGFRINLFDVANLRFEWGVPIGTTRPISEAGSSRFHISINFEG